MIRRKIFTSVAALTVVAMAWLTPSARAAFSIEVIINGGAPIIIADQSGSDSHPAVNDIGFQVTAAGVVVVGNAATTNVPGSAGQALIDLQYSVSSQPNLSGATVQILASATGFTQPPAGKMNLSNQIGGTATGPFSAFTASTTQDNTNTLFNTSGNTTPTMNITSSPYALTSNLIGFAGTDPFALTENLKLTVGANSLVTGDFAATVVTTPVPAPANILLALAGLPVFGVGYLRRRMSRSA